MGLKKIFKISWYKYMPGIYHTRVPGIYMHVKAIWITSLSSKIAREGGGGRAATKTLSAERDWIVDMLVCLRHVRKNVVRACNTHCWLISLAALLCQYCRFSAASLHRGEVVAKLGAVRILAESSRPEDTRSCTYICI